MCTYYLHGVGESLRHLDLQPLGQLKEIVGGVARARCTVEHAGRGQRAAELADARLATRRRYDGQCAIAHADDAPAGHAALVVEVAQRLPRLLQRAEGRRVAALVRVRREHALK